MRTRRILLIVSVLTPVGLNTVIAQNPNSEIIARIDHLVYATPDLERGIAEIEALLGVRASPGGKHPGRGTHNALISLGPRIYLEIIAPDPDQSGPVEPLVFGIGELVSSRLITWCANGTNLHELHQAAVRNAVPVGPAMSGSRMRPDGVTLRWEYTDPGVRGTDGVIPFFIEWGDSPHPARSSALGATLVGFRAEHPNAASFRKQLLLLGLDLQVDTAPRAALIAIIDSPRGRVELR